MSARGDIFVTRSKGERIPAQIAIKLLTYV